MEHERPPSEGRDERIDAAGPPVMRQDSPNTVDARTAPGSAQIIQYGFSERWLIIVCIVLGALGLIFGVSIGTWALVRSADAVGATQALEGELRAYTEAMNAQQQ